jgi:hypothetical protein
MIRKQFVKTIEFDAIQFDPDEHPWHRSISRDNHDGQFIEPPQYTCTIPLSHQLTIRPGDWIIVDGTGWNAQGVIPAYELLRPSFYHLKMVE